jgi:hypothetical protein
MKGETKNEKTQDRDSQRNRKSQPGGIPSGLPRGWVFVDVGAAQCTNPQSWFRVAGLREISGSKSRRDSSEIIHNNTPRPPVGIVRGQKGMRSMNRKETIKEYRQKIARGEMKPTAAQRELAGWLVCTPAAAQRELAGKNARRGLRRI